MKSEPSLPNATSSTAASESTPSLQGPDSTVDLGLQRHKRAREIRISFPKLQRLCQPQSETFWVLGGRPGSFKTGLLWNLALNAAEAGQRVLVVSLEMTPGELGLLALSRFSGLDRRRIQANFRSQDPIPFSDAERAAWDDAVVRYQKLELRMRLHGAELHGRTLASVLRSATRIRFDAVFVDHAGMIDRGARHELESLGEAIHALRGLSRGEAARDYRPWVVLTSQLSRGIDRGGEKGEDRTPLLADFRGSARFEHDADVALALQVMKRKTDDETPLSVLDAFVLKNRYGPAPAYVGFYANGATGLITERSHEQLDLAVER